MKWKGVRYLLWTSAGYAEDGRLSAKYHFVNRNGVSVADEFKVAKDTIVKVPEPWLATVWWLCD